MKSLERRFKNIEKRNPDWSTCLCFSEAVSRQNFSRQTIHRWFYKLVDKKDYDKKEVKQLLSYLRSHSKKA
jgi:hypothetical protein